MFASKLRIALLILVTVAVIGTIGYHIIENWNLIDSFYLTVTTLSTVGYGDFHPVTPYGRLFTIFYIILGVAMLGIFIQIAGKTALENLQHNVERREAKKKERQP